MTFFDPYALGHPEPHWRGLPCLEPLWAACPQHQSKYIRRPYRAFDVVELPGLSTAAIGILQRYWLRAFCERRVRVLLDKHSHGTREALARW